MSETIDASSTAQAMVTVLDQSQESHIDQLHRAAIGPVNTGYYLPILARFEAYDRGSPSWNWAASLCTLNWMAFRGLWRPALAYLATLVAAALGLMALTHFATGMAESIRWGLWSALATLAFLVPGFFGNIWLFNNHRKRLAQALAATPTLRDACLQLSRQASSRQRLLGLAMANGTLAITLASVWFWYPRSTLHDSARGERSGAVVGATVASGPASQSTGLASTPASAPSTDPHAAAAPAREPVPLTLPTEAASATASAAPMAAASDPVAPAAVAAAIQQAPLPVTAPRLSQAATRHAAIAARSRKAHARAAAPAAAPAPALAPVPAARPAVAPGGPARATPPPQRAPAASTGTTPPAPASRATAEGRYQINVGLFAQRDNAQRAVERLQGAGLPVKTQDLARASGTLTRVRVGPFATREQADAAAAQIRALQLDAVVVRP